MHCLWDAGQVTVCNTPDCVKEFSYYLKNPVAALCLDSPHWCITLINITLYFWGTVALVKWMHHALVWQSLVHCRSDVAIPLPFLCQSGRWGDHNPISHMCCEDKYW